MDGSCAQGAKRADTEGDDIFEETYNLQTSHLNGSRDSLRSNITYPFEGEDVNYMTIEGRFETPIMAAAYLERTQPSCRLSSQGSSGSTRVRQTWNLPEHRAQYPVATRRVVELLLEGYADGHQKRNSWPYPIVQACDLKDSSSEILTLLLLRLGNGA
ncbi:hypothetical protein DSL72_001826 [Monilinia vaccinii-corymbosi]|uniref:Uncharacterized protein n=1 Tax=Monilinia vaccinii-corymbosi TaxID=61207 RepID=A0A8A3PAW5_9HELO|nr:hypothetical protein DSL72_001826 [Monilinia vaccinii-corymbosi]